MNRFALGAMTAAFVSGCLFVSLCVELNSVHAQQASCSWMVTLANPNPCDSANNVSMCPNCQEGCGAFQNSEYTNAAITALEAGSNDYADGKVDCSTICDCTPEQRLDRRCMVPPWSKNPFAFKCVKFDQRYAGETCNICVIDYEGCSYNQEVTYTTIICIAE